MWCCIHVAVKADWTINNVVHNTDQLNILMQQTAVTLQYLKSIRISRTTLKSSAHIIMIKYSIIVAMYIITIYFYQSSLGELCCDEICPKSTVAHHDMVTSCFQDNRVVPVALAGSSEWQ